MEQIKFTEEEMTELRNNQQKFNDLIVKFGQLRIDKINLENAEIELNQKFSDLKKSDKEISDKLSAKYGDGVLNPETGACTPKNTETTGEIAETNKQ